MRVLAVLLAVLVLLLAACGGDDDEAADTGGAGGTAAQTVEVSATEFQFSPADITVEPGAVAFELSNDGSLSHALEIEGHGVEVESETIEGGASTTLETELEEGTYVIYCPVGDHRERGMEGTLTVGSGGGAGGTGTSTDETETGGHTGETDTGESGGDDDSGGSDDDDSAGSGY